MITCKKIAFPLGIVIEIEENLFVYGPLDKYPLDGVVQRQPPVNAFITGSDKRGLGKGKAETQSDEYFGRKLGSIEESLIMACFLSVDMGQGY